MGMEEGDLEYAISREDQEKNHMEFPGVLVFLGLKTSKRLTQFGWASRGKTLFCLKFPEVK